MRKGEKGKPVDNNKEMKFKLETKPRLSDERYPSEVRKLGQRAMEIFDVLYDTYLEKGHNYAEAFYYAANRTPDMFKTELRRSTNRLEPV